MRRNIILHKKGIGMTIHSSLATDLNIIAGKEAYDKEVKTLLANRRIIAIILKAVVVEFKDMDLSEIITYIEAQRENNPGYELVTRGIYYTAREISSQYGREFTNSEYNNIKKVYSIWICVSPDKTRVDGITEYSIHEKNVYHNAKVKKEVYDKLCVVMIYLKRNLDEESEYIINFLSVLLSEKIDYDRKIYILEKDLDLTMTEEIKEEVNTMCNLSEYVYESGIEQGIEQGIESGTDELIKAIQYIKEGSNNLKELTARGISTIIAQKAINLGIK